MLAGVFVALQSFAQMSVWKDTVVFSGFPKNNVGYYKTDTIYNGSAIDSMEVSWYKASDNLLTGWTGVGICDINNCYTYDNGTHSFKLPPNGKGLLYVDMKAAPTAADGCSYATIRLSEVGTMNTKDVVYKYCAWATAVKDVDGANMVTIYPNPASSFINIGLNDKRISSLNVLNVVGRRVAHFDIDASTPNPIRIPLENVADGVYLLQFADANGKLLGVRRVTKN